MNALTKLSGIHLSKLTKLGLKTQTLSGVFGGQPVLSVPGLAPLHVCPYPVTGSERDATTPALDVDPRGPSE